MIPILFGLGVMTCLGAGFNVVFSAGDWKKEAVWALVGLMGVAMMVGAIHFLRLKTGCS